MSTIARAPLVEQPDDIHAGGNGQCVSGVSAWSQYAEDLTAWVIARMVNRDDACGGYFLEDGETKRTTRMAVDKNGIPSKYWYAIEKRLTKHFRATRLDDIVGLHAISKTDNTSKWLAFDIDAHTDAADPDVNLKAAIEIARRLESYKLTGHIFSSDGKGGVHVLSVFDSPLPTAQIFALAKQVSANIDTKVDCETFPKQESVHAKRPYGNWLRVPGKHHTRDHWHKIWTGEGWADDTATVDAILRIEGETPINLPEPVAPAASVTSNDADRPAPSPETERRAVAHLDELPEAIEGKDGSGACYTAAVAMVHGFLLPKPVALRLLKEKYNPRCKPPWSDAELEHKVEDAATKEHKKPPGWLLKSKKKKTGSDGRSQADWIVTLAEKQYRIGRSSTDEPFAVKREGANVAIMFNGSRSELKASLARLYRKACGKVPNASALSDALCALAGEAHEAEAEPVALRLASHAGGVIIDIGDNEGRAIQVDPNGWRILPRSPVLFHRTALSAPMPIPQRHAGGLDMLRGVLNVNDDDWSLLVGYLVSTFFPDPSHPVLLIGGQQGTGKTTASRLVVETIDPSTCPLRSEPKNLEAWTIAAAGSWAVCLDNLSEIREWLSDAICRAATGDGLVKRKLYTGGELDVFSFRRCVILNSIDAGAMRGDLGERLLLIELQPISPKHRRTDAAVNAEFVRNRPAILGGLLDLVSEVMAILPDVQIESMGRMADFDRILAAVDQVRGTDARAVYERSTAQIAEAVVESDLVSVAIKAYFENPNAVMRLCGTSTQLSEALRPDPAPKDWPKSARAFGGQLRRLIPALSAIGIEVTPPLPSDGSRIYTLVPKLSESDRTTALAEGKTPLAIPQTQKNTCAVDENPTAFDRTTAQPTALAEPTGRERLIA